jgi:nucleoid DNA-binding protein
MNELMKERFEVTAKVVAILGGIISAIALVVTLQSSTEQRASELRWKQANLAMELVDTMLSDSQAFDALRMIDWYGRTYQISIDEEAVIGSEDIRYSLDVQNNDNLSPSDVFVRESFDRLFYHMGRIERSVRTELIKFDDVRSPLGYYAEILCNEYKTVLTPYTTQLRVDDAQKLLDRFLIDECISTGEANTIIAEEVNNESLFDVISEETGIDLEAVQYTMEVFLENIKQRLANGETVTLLGFGAFSVRERATRSGRNPGTGEGFEIPGKNVPSFKPGKSLRDALNTGSEGKEKFTPNENLSNAIAEQTGIDREDVRNIMEVSLKNIKQRLANGETVTFLGFGAFSVRERATRSGRNPGTDEGIEITSRKVIKFKPAKAFKNAVNAEAEG